MFTTEIKAVLDKAGALMERLDRIAAALEKQNEIAILALEPRRERPRPAALDLNQAPTSPVPQTDAAGKMIFLDAEHEKEWCDWLRRVVPD